MCEDVSVMISHFLELIIKNYIRESVIWLFFWFLFLSFVILFFHSHKSLRFVNEQIGELRPSLLRLSQSKTAHFLVRSESTHLRHIFIRVVSTLHTHPALAR